jgi:cytochrome c-type biogenesis protein CcmF
VIPELGHFALILAGLLSIALGVIPLWGAWRLNTGAMQFAHNLATGQFVFTLLAFIALSIAFAQDDFTVKYVAQNSNSLLPMQYKLSAVWGAHEGSFLLWTLIMTTWTLAVAQFGRSLPLVLHARVLGILGLITVGFIAFMLFTSNPFERLLPLGPAQGRDLNPLLQDFGLIVHPPLLYAGYVGFAVPFAFALAALMTGRLDAAWARWTRPWTNAAWAFLTVGIALGSWWAYYELGWGGWWFWDPVENASFMPWLVGTALVHSIAVTEKRGVFKSWTVLLAIFTFSLSLLGAFIVRSGVLTSVHSFAVDPTRGAYILGFLLAVVGGALTLYALRAPVMASDARYGGVSREVLLLLNNVLLVVAMVTVLIGTLAPLAYEAWTGGGKISIGPPYFNAVFVPLMAALGVLLCAAPYARWKHMPLPEVARKLVPPLAVAVVLGVLLPLIFADVLRWQAIVAVALASWILLAHGQELFTRVKRTGRTPPLAHLGMHIAHAGFAVTIIGVCLTSHYSSERDLRMTIGETVSIGAYDFRFDGVAGVQGPNFVADRGNIAVLQGEKLLEFLHPEKRRYVASGDVMTEAAIDPGFFGDVYVALGEPLAADAWSVRVHVKPFVRWVWFGAMLMALGGIVAVLDPRYRRLRRAQALEATPEPVPASPAAPASPASARVSP